MSLSISSSSAVKYAKNGDTAGLEHLISLIAENALLVHTFVRLKIPLLHYMRVGKNYVMAKRAEQKK
jgi:hypothetical protein